MKLIIDEKTLIIDGEKVFKHIQSLYHDAGTKLDTPLEFVSGGKTKKFDFSRKSVLRTGLKALLVPVAMPVLDAMFNAKGLEPTPREKHSDLIDYLVTEVLRFFSLVEKDITLYAKSIETDDENIRIIKSLSTTRGKSTDTATIAPGHSKD